MLPYGPMVYHPYGTRVVLYQNGYQSTRNRLRSNIRVHFYQIQQVAGPSKPIYFRKYTSWLYSFFLIFRKSFIAKVFFVPPVYSQIVKTPNFDPHLAPPTFEAGPGLPIFVIRVHGCIHYISLVRIRDTFAVVRTLVPVTRGMTLKNDRRIEFWTFKNFWRSSFDIF